MSEPNEIKPTDNLWEANAKAEQVRLQNRVRIVLNAACESLENLEHLRVQLDSAISQVQAARDTAKDASLYLATLDLEQVGPRCSDVKSFLTSAYLSLSVLGSLKKHVTIPDDSAYRTKA